MGRSHPRLDIAAVILCACALLGGSCKSGDDGDKPVAEKGPFYVAVGDSYTSGVQRVPGEGIRSTRNGFAYQVPQLAKATGRRLTLVNFGCGGATTTSVLEEGGCRLPAVGGRSYGGKTQADAAVDFVTAHKADIGLVTVLIGGNDLIKCARLGPQFEDCTRQELPRITGDIRKLVTRLRTAAGPTTPIIGLTYPDMFLGAWVWPGIDRRRVETSVPVFQSIFNPALKQEYEAVGGRFVDITASTGGYDPLSAMTTVAPYGSIPTPVARICEITYYCQWRDVHATTGGYRLIAQQVVDALGAPAS